MPVEPRAAGAIGAKPRGHARRALFEGLDLAQQSIPVRLVLNLEIAECCEKPSCGCRVMAVALQLGNDLDLPCDV
jgi:hypothetical protein